jgi:transcriptional regulator with XRE-family HTH domain
MTFADMLRDAMNGMTQEQLEDRSGVSQGEISRYLRGEAEPKLTQLEALERALPRLRQLRAERFQGEVA